MAALGVEHVRTRVAGERRGVAGDELRVAHQRGTRTTLGRALEDRGLVRRSQGLLDRAPAEGGITLAVVGKHRDLGGVLGLDRGGRRDAQAACLIECTRCVEPDVALRRGLTDGA